MIRLAQIRVFEAVGDSAPSRNGWALALESQPIIKFICRKLGFPRKGGFSLEDWRPGLQRLPEECPAPGANVVQCGIAAFGRGLHQACQLGALFPIKSQLPQIHKNDDRQEAGCRKELIQGSPDDLQPNEDEPKGRNRECQTLLTRAQQELPERYPLRCSRYPRRKIGLGNVGERRNTGENQRPQQW
jgi:hypothetical protein